MHFFSGLSYQFRGLGLGIRTPRLCFLGLVRFLIVIVITVLLASLVVDHHREILSLVWKAPASKWILWFWQLVSWLLAALLVGLSALAGYLLSQIFFSVLIMDAMSRITEKMVTGRVIAPPEMGFFRQLLELIWQEIPRALLPVALLMGLMVAGWLTPLGPVISIVSSCLSVIFLAWDNTDLTDARRMAPFRERFNFLLSTLTFHLGFGLPFLVPVLNVLLLSFAPVGATLFQIERRTTKDSPHMDRSAK
jgi:CysZ protein